MQEFDIQNKSCINRAELPQLKVGIPNIGIGYVTDAVQIGHFFAMIIFKDASGVTACIYDPIMYKKQGYAYEYNGVFTFQTCFKKIKIVDLSKY